MNMKNSGRNLEIWGRAKSWNPQKGQQSDSSDDTVTHKGLFPSGTQEESEKGNPNSYKQTIFLNQFLFGWQENSRKTKEGSDWEK